jgi:hypothetical protein
MPRHATRAAEQVAWNSRTIVLPGQDLTAAIITELADGILALDHRLKALDAQIEVTFAEHPHATAIQSVPGLRPFPGTSTILALPPMFLVAALEAWVGLIRPTRPRWGSRSAISGGVRGLLGSL